MSDHLCDKSGSHNKYGCGQEQRGFEYLPVFFLAVALAFLPTKNGSESLNSFSIVFVSIVLETIPFMLVGSLVGGFIETFVSREQMTSILPGKGWVTVCVAATAGIVFPVCECAVVPVVRRLIGKGLPFQAAIAYLLGGPIVNPVVATSTALAYGFDWRVVMLRLGLGYGLAVVIGLIMGKVFEGIDALKDIGTSHVNERLSCGCSDLITPTPLGPMLPFFTDNKGITETCGCGHEPSPSAGWAEKTGAAFTHALDDFLAVGYYLVIGAFIAALAQTYLNRSGFMGTAATPVWSVLLMMALAVLLNLCSEADAFIAASFRGLIPLPAQMAFLLTGPMFDLKLLLMYQRVFKPKAIVVLSTLVLGFVLVASLGLVALNGVLQ